MKLLYHMHKNIKKDKKNLPAQERARQYSRVAAVFCVCKKMNFQAHGKMI